MRKIVTEEAVTMPPAPRDRGLGDALLVSLVFPNAALCIKRTNNIPYKNKAVNP